MPRSRHTWRNSAADPCERNGKKSVQGPTGYKTECKWPKGYPIACFRDRTRQSRSKLCARWSGNLSHTKQVLCYNWPLLPPYHCIIASLGHQTPVLAQRSPIILRWSRLEYCTRALSREKTLKWLFSYAIHLFFIRNISIVVFWQGQHTQKF